LAISPQGLSLGDGLLFLMVAIPFGLIYSLFLYSVLSSGIALYWAIQFFCGLPRKFRGKQREYLRNAEIKVLIFSGVCVLPLFMFLMGNKHDIFVMFMIVLSVCLFYFFTIKTIKWRESIKLGIVLPDDKMPLKTQLNKKNNEDLSKMSFAICSFVVTIVLFPLLSTSVIGQSLERAMYWAQVRVEHSILHVKHPYSSLLPENLINHNAVTAQDFTAFENVTILFQGIGNNVVVDFKDGEYLRQLRIPNDSVIVEKKSSLLKQKINN